MLTYSRFFTFLVCFGVLLASVPTQAAYYQVWRAGVDNGGNGDFVQENGSSNLPPGQPAVRDDDWYFAGTYPSPIGVVTTDDLNNTFERALTGGDPTDRIHFNLDTQEASHGTLFQIVVDTVSNNYSAAPDGDISFDVLFNGVNVGSYVVNTSSYIFTTAPFSAGSVGASTGENVITLQRTEAGGGWMQFDRIDLLAQVPEPSTFVALVGMALLGLLFLRKRGRK